MADETPLVQAWVDGVEVSCIRGHRFCSYEDETVVIGSQYDDGTAYVTVVKTFPKGTMEAARRKWKTMNYANHYGSNPFTAGQQNPYTWQTTQAQADFISEMMRQAWKSHYAPKKDI